MAVYDLEEQEQLDALKAWWNQYGNLLVSVLTAVLLVVAGYFWWQRHQDANGAEASAVYSVLEKAVAEKDMKRVKDVTGELVEKYAGTLYATHGALLAAKVHAEAGDSKTAETQLNWVIEHGAADEFKAFARLNLAAVLLDEKRYDDAFRLVDPVPESAFGPRFAEMRGDILFAQGKLAAAREAYQLALTRLDGDQSKRTLVEGPEAKDAFAAYRDTLQIKADALEHAK